MKEGRGRLRISQIEDKVILETFLRWVRTSANFEEVPWLSFGPKVPKLPSARNNSVSSTFLTAESFGIFLIHFKNLNSFDFLQNRLTYFKIVCLHSKSLSQRSSFFGLINFKSTGVEAVIGATFCHQGSVVASLDNASVVHHHDDIGIDNRR